MGKLHEVLAVEGGLKSTADKILNEAHHTFVNKRGHFQAQARTYEKVEEDSLDYPGEIKPMETTVQDKLDYVLGHFKKALDATYQKEQANTEARASIKVGDKVIAKDVPATFLLNMEGRFKELRALYLAIPTLDPGRDWKKDETQTNIYKSDPVQTYKTEKVVKPLLLAPATKEHPAQVDKISMDKTVGKWNTVNWSGAIPNSDKSKMLGKVDTLLRAIKKARMRANDQELKDVKIGSALVKFINS